MPSVELPSTEALKHIPSRARRTVEDILDATWKRFAAVGTAIAGLISALLVGNMSLVATITAIPGQIWAVIVATPGMVWGFIASIPGMLWGVGTGAAGAGTGWVVGLLESWGMSMLATGVAVVADRPWIFGLLVFGGGVAYVGPERFRDDFKVVIQLLLLSVFGYVSALTLGEGLLANLPLVVVA